jgi:hypothetical protein
MSKPIIQLTIKSNSKSAMREMDDASHIPYLLKEMALELGLKNIPNLIVEMPTNGVKAAMSEHELEKEIQSKGLIAPRLTPALIDEAIAGEAYHVFDGSCLTVCCLTLQNGFTVTGESACASPENFDAETGREVSRQNARNKIWMLEGYLLKQRLSEQTNYDIVEPL